ncbi:MAG: FkbM family methyltransferase, partial [Epsilonproteobacteria bacterium]|nr:FkbM family methyltransferase [Campylobacterota bacterium]
KERLYFNEEKSFSTIYGKGTQSVEVDTIDNILKERVDYIKMDIEGAEQDAIDGAKQSIKKYKPILAICIYHKAEDWYKIPQVKNSIFSYFASSLFAIRIFSGMGSMSHIFLKSG